MTTPIITAALAKKPHRNPRAIPTPRGRGEGKTRAHNYLAQAPKKQPGAPLGNRNAACPGAQKRRQAAALLKRIRAFCARANRIAEQVVHG